MVYAEFAIDEKRGALYGFSDVVLLRFKSDDQAPRFLNLWQHTVQGDTEKQPDGNLMTLLKAQLENSPALKLDMAHISRLPKGGPERTYLMTSLKRFVDTAKKKQNMEKTLIKLSGGQQRPTVLAVPAEEERDTNVCIAFQNTGSCRFGERCRFTHSPGSAAPKAKAKAKPKPKAGLKAKPAAKPKAAPKAGRKTEYDPEQLAARAKIPCRAATHSPTEDAASETGATILIRRIQRTLRCTSWRSTSPTTLISRTPLRRKKVNNIFMASSTTRASSS